MCLEAPSAWLFSHPSLVVPVWTWKVQAGVGGDRGRHLPSHNTYLRGIQGWKAQSLTVGAASSLLLLLDCQSVFAFFCVFTGTSTAHGGLFSWVYAPGASSSWVPVISSQCHSYCWLCLSFNEEIIPSDLFLVSLGLWALKTVVFGPLIGEMKNYQGVKLISLFTEWKRCGWTCSSERKGLGR